MKKYLSILFTFSFTYYFGCNCPKDTSIVNNIKEADIVFSGKIVSKKTLKISSNITYLPNVIYERTVDTVQILEVKFAITRLFNGVKSSDTVTVYTSSSSADCGFKFMGNDEFIVFGVNSILMNDQNERNYPSGTEIYWTSSCQMTKRKTIKMVKQIESVI